MIEFMASSKPLSKIKNGAGIPFLTPQVSPGTHCPMRLASVISQDIRGLSSLLVGMPECATYSRMFNPSPENEYGDFNWLYVLDSREIVFGCREGVMEALIKMQNEGAKAILVTGTCIPDLIGEDFSGMLEELKPQLRIKVAHTMLGQFKNISYPSGSWKTMEAMAQLMDPRAINKYRVNVLGRSSEEAHLPMPSLCSRLEEKGLLMRYLAPGSTLEEFQEAPDASLNLVISPYGQPLAVSMAQKFGTPFISLHDAYSIEDIDEKIGAVYERMGLSLGEDFLEERIRAEALEKVALQLCFEMKFALALRIDLPLPLSIYLINQLKMIPALIHLEEFYPEDHVHSKAIVSSGLDPQVCRIVDESNAWSIIKSYKPDIGLGYLPQADFGVPWVENMLDFYGQIGYSRSAAFLTRLIDSVKNREVKNGLASI